MSAVIQNEYTGNNSTTTYSFTFPYLKTSDIKASLDGVATTAFTLPNATTLQFNTAPGSGVSIKIFRETSVDDLTATFYAGSAIKSEDLNDNFTQNLYKTQEVGARSLNTLGGTMTGDLTLGTQADIVFEGATADAHETTIKVVDPTADRTITFPNVTGTVVTTGDTGTVATAMIAADAVTNAKIADNSIDSGKYVDGSIDEVHLSTGSVTTPKLGTNSVTTAKIVDGSVTTPKLGTDSVTTAKIVDGNVTEGKLAVNSVTSMKIASGSVTTPKLGTDSVTTAKIVDGNITLAKMADDSVGTAELVDGSVDTARLADNSVTLAKMTDNSVGTSEIVDSAVTTAKLAANAVTNEKIATSTIQTGSIANEAITNVKLAANAVRTAQIADSQVSADKIATGAVTTPKLGTDSVTTVKIVDSNVTTAKLADAELKTLAGMQSGTASKLAAGTTLTADIADLNQLDGLTKQTVLSNTQSSFPTSAAVVDFVASQIQPLGGLEVVSNELSFPNSQPSSGVVISISDAGGVVFNGSGTSTTGRTVGGSTVTINNAPSSLNSETLAAGVGLMVSSTGSGQVYNYHKILGKEEDIKQLSDDINDFNARYRVGSSNPTSALDGGDLFFNTTTGKLLVYNNTNTAWEEAQSIGNFFISTLSESFNGIRTEFTVSNAPTNAQQLILSINGVIQKPNAGTSAPSEGFALDGSTVKLAAAPATGSTYFAVVMGSTVNIGTPSNNTVTTNILQNGSVTTAKIVDDAVTTAKIADDAVDTAQILNNAVTNSKLTPEAVTLDKIVHGTSSNDGKFLRANNGADPTFESVITDLVNDTSPQLGGDLDTNNFDIHISDNKNLEFGASADLYIKHSVGHNANFIVSYNGDIEHHMTSSKKIIKGFQNSGTPYVALYHDNNKKFETYANGIKYHGHQIGQVNGSYFQWQGANSNAFAAGMTSGADQPTGSDNHLQFHHWNNSSWDKVFYVHRDFINIPDNKKIGFGDSNDLQIYHDGSYNWIKSGVDGRTLHIDHDITQIRNHGGTEVMAKFFEDGAVELYHNNSKKFETSSTGVTVTGNVRTNGISQLSGNLSISNNDTSNGVITFATNTNDCWRMEFNGDFEPHVNNSVDIGSPSKRVKNIYTNDLCLSNKGSSNDVDGTWGDWTIQEGESDLFLKNNRSGKKYKFNLTEVS